LNPFAKTPRARAAHQRAVDNVVERRGGKAAKPLREHMDREAALVARAYSKGERWQEKLDPEALGSLLYREVWKPVFMDAARETWDQAMDRARKDMEDDAITRWMDIVLQYLRAGNPARARLQAITQTSIDLISRLIDSLAAEGFSVRDISKKLLEQIPEMNRSRAERIARTEVHAALNQGTMVAGRDAAKELGLTGTKVWISTPDERTRWWHRDVEAVPIDEKFQVPNPNGGVDEMDYPGDMTAPPENVVACRCTTAFVLDEPDWMR
jgi:hypothetical protein